MASVEKHGDRFRVVWRADGKKLRRSFNTEDEARAFAANPLATLSGSTTIGIHPILSAMMAGRHTPTVVEYARPLVEDPGLRTSSRDIYRYALRKIDGTKLGDTPVGKVNPTDLREFLNGLSADRRNVSQFLGKVFNAAVREGIVNVSPLVRGGIRRPAVPQKDMQPLSVEEVEKLVKATGSERDALCIRIGAYVGLRGGEVGGLRVQDIDPEACKIHVRQNATTTSEGRAIGELKTRSSRRSLKVACSLTAEIAEYIAANPPCEDGLIFRTRRGGYVTSWTLSHATQSAAKRAGMRPVSFHDLRHTCASLLIHANAPAKSIQRYLGHSSIRMTMDVYGHLFPSSDDALAEAMEAMRVVYRNGGES